MSPTVLDRPAPTRVPPPQRSSRSPAKARPRQAKWVLPAAIAISVFVHLVAFLAFRFTVTISPPEPAGRPLRVLSIEPSMQVVQVTPIPEPASPQAPPPAAQRREPDPVPPEPTRVAPPATVLTPPVTAVPERSAADPDPSLFERVRPKADARLIVPLLPPEDNLTETDRALLPLYAALDAMNEADRAAALAALKATDWTKTDANGNRWGISAGKIHLGKITLPLPFGFSVPPGRRDEIAGRLRGWSDIRRQAGDTEVRETVEERAKAIRERQNAKRDTTASTRKN